MVLKGLQNASNDVLSLQNYLDDNFDLIYDYFINQSHTELVASRNELNKYILLNRTVILDLNISKKTNLSFVLLLLDISEELGLISSFHFLYEHLIAIDFNIGERLKAASLYLIGINNDQDYLNGYDSIYNHLQLSVESEEDNSDKVLMTMVNYYAKVIIDFGAFNIGVVKTLNAKIEKSLVDFEFSFLHSELIEDILNIDFSCHTEAYDAIHLKLDLFLGREIDRPTYLKEFLIETDTNYCNLLAEVDNSFNSVRQISVVQYQLVLSNKIFESLGRGVTILTDESQLYGYMYSYGNMHYEKLFDAFTELPKEYFDLRVNLIDWGCGQALATMTYYDYLNQNKIAQEITSITLIEPSEIALRRASLHVRKFSPKSIIHTINKDLDGLINDDFSINSSKTYLHLFSNILDIARFSMKSLLALVESKFPGNNYFISVSPSINDLRDSRVDHFVSYFSKKNNFSMIHSQDNSVGTWKNGWTRIVRVFQVTL